MDSLTHIAIHHHADQSPIAIEWVIEVVLDDGLFFVLIHQCGHQEAIDQTLPYNRVFL